jgi:hypothetical protein
MYMYVCVFCEPNREGLPIAAFFLFFFVSFFFYEAQNYELRTVYKAINFFDTL